MVSSFLYSVIVTLVFTLMGMIACTCAAYPLSRKRLKGRTFFTFILMFPMYFSAGLIPTYLLYSDLHMLDTVWVLILPLIYASIQHVNYENLLPVQYSGQLGGGSIS